MKISLIAAMSTNRVIGKNGRLPWGHLPADWANLDIVTADCPMIMGRKSYDTPDRVWSKVGNVVITRQKDLVLDAGFVRAGSLLEALQILRGGNFPEIFVLGGGEIFKEAICHADTIHLTVVNGEFEGDAFFPDIDLSVFELVSEKYHPKDAEHKLDFVFQVFERRFSK
jgi:dihydrofolate reductase